MKLTLILTAIAVAVFFICLRFVDPAPPRRIVLATGMSGGAYQELGEKYRAALAKAKVTVELRQTSGTVENLRLLKEKQVDLIFAQTGVGDASEYPDFTTLASVGFEPWWVFYRGDKLNRLHDLQGKKIAVGAPESGGQALTLRLLVDNGLADPALHLAIGGAEAAAALRMGSIDAACFVASIKAPLIQSLLQDQSIHLLSLDRVQSYPTRYPFLSGLTLPHGAFDLAKDIPGEDIHLVSPVMTLVARNDFHPALTSLLLRTATDIHGSKGVFEDAAQFPSMNFVQFPVSDDTRHFLNHGPNFLSRTLPFWLATSIERLAILILPLLTLLIPLFRLAPPIYVWRVRRQIYRWYEKLVHLEQQLRAALAKSPAGEEAGKIREKLSQLSNEVTRVKVPLSYMDELYRLRTHIELVRKGELLPESPGDPPPAKA